MTKLYYYNENGEKVGISSTEEIKSLVARGIITPQTSMETAAGRKGLAGQMPGLFPATQTETDTDSPTEFLNETYKKASLLAMPLLKDKEFDYEAVIQRLRNHWGISIRHEDITSSSPSDQTCVFNIAEHIVAMSLMPFRVPDGEFDSLFPVSLYWSNAEEDTALHQSHIVVFLRSEMGTAIERHSLFTKVIESILVETNSLGVYQGNQTLLISREIYLDMAQVLLANDKPLPLLLWIFIGMGQSPKGNTLYTFGLSGFEKLEMEIVDSQKDGEDLYSFLVDICSYVISNDVTFTKGETVGHTEDVIATIDISKGICLDGETIKLQM